MKTCGECTCFKPVPADRVHQGIQGDGWCDIKMPVDFERLMWGRPKEAIRKDRPACTLGPIVTSKKAGK